MDDLEIIAKMFVEQGILCEAWIDGSFLTRKLEPNDVDVVFVISNAAWNSLSSAQLDFLDCFDDMDEIKNGQCDVYFSAPENREYWSEMFGSSRRGEPKGIVAVSIPEEIVP